MSGAAGSSFPSQPRSWCDDDRRSSRCAPCPDPGRAGHDPAHAQGHRSRVPRLRRDLLLDGLSRRRQGLAPARRDDPQLRLRRRPDQAGPVRRSRLDRRPEARSWSASSARTTTASSRSHPASGTASRAWAGTPRSWPIAAPIRTTRPGPTRLDPFDNDIPYDWGVRRALMRVLVTGAAGFIGAHVTRQLIERGHQAYALVRPGDRAPRLADVRTRVELIEADLADGPRLADLLAEIEPDAIIHLAWYAEPGEYRHALAENVDSLRVLGRPARSGAAGAAAAGSCSAGPAWRTTTERSGPSTTPPRAPSIGLPTASTMPACASRAATSSTCTARSKTSGE